MTENVILGLDTGIFQKTVEKSAVFFVFKVSSYQKKLIIQRDFSGRGVQFNKGTATVIILMEGIARGHAVVVELVAEGARRAVYIYRKFCAHWDIQVYVAACAGNFRSCGRCVFEFEEDSTACIACIEIIAVQIFNGDFSAC